VNSLSVLLAVVIAGGACDGSGRLPFYAKVDAKAVRTAACLTAQSPHERVRVSVDLSVSYDSATAAYRYEFRVSNEPNAQNSVRRFGIAPAPDPLAAGAPAKWDGFYGYQERDDALVWAVMDDSTPPPIGWSEGQPYPSPFEIQPGETKEGFWFETKEPPLEFSFYAQGFDTLPTEDDVVDVPYPSVFVSGVSGTFTVLGVEPAEAAHGNPGLQPSCPNPAKGNVTVSFVLSAAADVHLAVYDANGRRVRTLINQHRAPGLHAVTWNGCAESGAAVSPGVYFARLMVNGRSVGSQRVTILR